jgi:hypothetical protein
MATKAPNQQPMGRDTDFEPMSVGRTLQAADPYKGGWLTHRPVSTPTRLILNFETSFWCSRSTGFVGEDLKDVPPPLAARGVSRFDPELVQHL